MLNPLNVGDKVAVVATAKRLEKSIEPGLSVLKNWGLQAVTGPNLENNSEYFASTDAGRLADLQWALDNPEIKAIIFARGGYGTSKILDRVDFTRFCANPKWTVGFSDLTSFLLHTKSFGMPSVHGPMAYTIGQENESDNELKRLLFGESIFEFSVHINPLNALGITESEITGGNLSLIYESIGAANEIDTDGKILFLEEIGEAFYSVDRMLNKLKRIGKFDKLKGVFIGDFTNVKDSSGYFTRSLDELIFEYFSHINGPILFGFPGGHESRNMPLLFHAKAKVAVTSSCVTIEYLKNKAS